jgi:hypothetical protein
MKTLEILFNELFESKKWNFYGIESFENPLQNENFKSFITKYIENSGKGSSNPLMENLQHPHSEGHVFSTFFLGIILYENCKEIRVQIDKKINYYRKRNKGSVVSFYFMWFIISLFHDSGYQFEQKNEYRTIEEFKRSFDITRNQGRRRGIPKQISAVWEKYFSYKLNSLPSETKRKPDHGILAGILLNDTLVKTYLHVKEVKDTPNDQFEYHGLFWSKKLLDIYNMCSWIVLAHNIFFKNEDVDPIEDIEIYREADLGSLIIKSGEEPIINMHNFPFLFLLCLVDTIEPYKLHRQNTVSILRNCEMEFSEKEVFIRFSDASLVEKSFDGILKMHNWLRLNVNDEKGIIKITIK